MPTAFKERNLESVPFSLSEIILIDRQANVCLLSCLSHQASNGRRLSNNFLLPLLYSLLSCLRTKLNHHRKIQFRHCEINRAGATLRKRDTRRVSAIDGESFEKKREREREGEEGRKAYFTITIVKNWWKKISVNKHELKMLRRWGKGGCWSERKEENYALWEALGWLKGRMNLFKLSPKSISFCSFCFCFYSFLSKGLMDWEWRIGEKIKEERKSLVAKQIISFFEWLSFEMF